MFKGGKTIVTGVYNRSNLYLGGHLVDDYIDVYKGTTVLGGSLTHLESIG